jgi:hypothetical protein
MLAARVPSKPPMRVSGTGMQSHRAKRVKNSEMGRAPVLFLPHRMDFNTVRMMKTIPRKKQEDDENNSREEAGGQPSNRFPPF